MTTATQAFADNLQTRAAVQTFAYVAPSTDELPAARSHRTATPANGPN